MKLIAVESVPWLLIDGLPSAARRADLRFGTGPENRLFLLNKQDGTIREIVR